MAAMPKRRRMKAALVKRARAEVGSDATALDYVCAWIARGGLVKDLAASLQEQLRESVSRSILSTLVHHLSPDAPARIADARRAGATARVEDAVQIAKYVSHTSSASIVNAQLDRTWPPAHPDHASHGDKDSRVGVRVDVAQLHLEALRSRRIARRPPIPKVPPRSFLKPTCWFFPSL